MSHRESPQDHIKVSLNDQELARLDELRGDDERAVHLRRLLHEPPDGSARRNQYTIHARFPIPDPIARGQNVGELLEILTATDGSKRRVDRTGTSG